MRRPQAVIMLASSSQALHETSLKIFFRSVESDSESSSKVTKLNCEFLERFQEMIFENHRNSEIFEKI